MWLFVIFCIIVACCTCPAIILVYASPFIAIFGWMVVCAIKEKIRTGYFFPWEHREELKKKCIKV